MRFESVAVFLEVGLKRCHKRCSNDGHRRAGGIGVDGMEQCLTRHLTLHQEPANQRVRVIRVEGQRRGPQLLRAILVRLAQLIAQRVEEARHRPIRCKRIESSHELVVLGGEDRGEPLFQDHH